MNTRPTTPRCGSPHRQAGLAALGLAASLSIGCAAWLASGWLRSQLDRRATLAVAQVGSLRQAERALAFFAATHARLPCPAAAPGGSEDCGVADGRGWLPLATLGAAGSAAGPDDMPVRYERLGPQGDAAPGVTSASTSDGYDFCTRLRAASADDANPWRFPRREEDPRGPEGIPAAYGLTASASASAGVDPGFGTAFRAATGLETVHASLECASATASLDALAIGAGWTGPVLDLQASNAKKADALVQVMRFLITHRTLELELAVLDLGAGVYALLDNQAKLQLAIAGTLAGFPPPVDAIPTFIAGIASAGQALRLNAIDIPRAAVSLALDEATLERYRAAARLALLAQPWQGQDRLLEQVRELGLGAGTGLDTGTPSLH